MDQQRFCINCGQPLVPGNAFCVSCGTQVSAPSTAAPAPSSAGMQPGNPPPYAQAPAQEVDPLLAGLAAGYIANRLGRPPQRRARRGSGLLGCGCLLLILAVLAGPFIGVALTSGGLRQIFVYAAVGIIILVFLMIVISQLASREGRASLLEGILGALFGDGG